MTENPYQDSSSKPGASTTASAALTAQNAGELLEQLRQNINASVIGQREVVDQILIALLCNGHVLIEGVPGLGKTLLVRSLAHCFAGEFKRIQFTPDLMPADITGHVLFDMKENQFRLRKGPVFCNLLLADEINRAPAKTQAALLEVMQERQVTLEGKARPLPLPFMVLATQNPIEQEGTYPLPEAELDRFLIKVYMDYPSIDDEVTLTRQITTDNIDDNAAFSQRAAVLSAAQIFALQNTVAAIAMDEQVLEYAVRLVRATRDSPALYRGAGSRACIALVRCARAKALLRGADFVIPDDVKQMASAVMRHRVALAAEMEIDQLSVDDVLEQIFSTVAAPRL